MTVTLVAAVGANNVIGANGALPWSLPDDLAHFKRLTLGHPIVMGRATFESIGRPLPGRTTIVVTRQPDWAAEGVQPAGSLHEALDLAARLDDEVFVVGGAQLYTEALARDLIDRMVISRVRASPEGDTHFPVIDWQQWSEVGRTAHRDFDAVTYSRALSS